jgi:hypothetical protein
VSESEGADGQKSCLSKRDLPSVSNKQILALNANAVNKNERQYIGDVFWSIPGNQKQ